MIAYSGTMKIADMRRLKEVYKQNLKKERG